MNENELICLMAAILLADKPDTDGNTEAAVERAFEIEKRVGQELLRG